jgi:integrase
MRAKIRKKGSRWYLSVVDAAGQERAHGGFRTKKEAQARAAELVTDSRRGRYTAPEKLTVAEYLHGWLEGRQAADISVGTRDLEALMVRAYIVPHIGRLPLREVGTKDLQRLYATLRERGGKGGRPLRGKSVRNCHGLLTKALGDAVRHEPPLLAVNPTQSLDPPARDDSVERRAWTKEEARRFLEVAAGDRLGAIWRLALATGVRRGELLGLRWPDISPDADSITIRRQVLARSQRATTEQRVYVREQTKTRRHRKVRIDGYTAHAIGEWKVAQNKERLAFGPAWKKDGELGIEAPWVVTEPDGKVIHPETMRRRFQRLAREAGVPDIPLHGTRHSYAVLALGAGVRLDVVSRNLGHASISTTADIYAHDDEEAAAEAAERVAAVIFPRKEAR